MRCRIVGSLSAALVRRNRESSGLGRPLFCSPPDWAGSGSSTARGPAGVQSRTPLSFAREVNEEHYEESDGHPSGRSETAGRKDAREETNHEGGTASPISAAAANTSTAFHTVAARTMSGGDANRAIGK